MAYIETNNGFGNEIDESEIKSFVKKAYKHFMSGNIISLSKESQHMTITIHNERNFSRLRVPTQVWVDALLDAEEYV